MIFQLREYQERTVDAIRQIFIRGMKSAILCIPTGGGKTVVFSHIARSATDLGKRVMIVCDRKELIKQSYAKLTSYGLWPTVIAPGYPQMKSNCYVASVDTLVRRQLPDVDLIIVDEAHKATFDKLLRMYEDKPVRIIGATATPIRTGKQRSLHEMYDAIVNPVTVKELISDGYLAPAITYGADVDLTSIRDNKQEYNEFELFKFYNKQKRYDGVIEKYNQFCQQGQTIVFNVNREHSRNMCAEFNDAGIPAVHVDGSMNNFRRQQAFNQFESGAVKVLTNCSIATTGYDFAGIHNVIVNRATKSLSLWLQMCGRGSRVEDKDVKMSIGKTHFNIIDMGSNTKEHGFWEQDRVWDLVKPKKKDTLQPAPMKECPECEALVYASVMTCPHCDYNFPQVVKPLPEADFVQLEEKQLPERLRKPIYKMNNPELEEYARLKGYKPGWVMIQQKLRKTGNVRPLNKRLGR